MIDAQNKCRQHAEIDQALTNIQTRNTKLKDTGEYSIAMVDAPLLLTYSGRSKTVRVDMQFSHDEAFSFPNPHDTTHCC